MKNRNIYVSEKLHYKLKLYCFLNKKKIGEFVEDTLEHKLKDVKFKEVKL